MHSGVIVHFAGQIIGAVITRLIRQQVRRVGLLVLKDRLVTILAASLRVEQATWHWFDVSAIHDGFHLVVVWPVRMGSSWVVGVCESKLITLLEFSVVVCVLHSLGKLAIPLGLVLMENELVLHWLDPALEIPWKVRIGVVVLSYALADVDVSSFFEDVVVEARILDLSFFR